MATKLTGALAKRVKALGISGSTEEAVKPKLLEILEENGIEQMDDEELITIVEIAETFVNDTTSDDEDENDDIDEEAEADELAEEVEEEDKASKKKAEKPAKKEASKAKKATKKVVEQEEEPEDEDENVSLEDMSREELKAYIKEKGLEISVKKSWSDDDIRDAINALLEPEEEDDEEQEEDDEEQEEEPEDEDENVSLEDMSREELKAYIKEKGLEISVKKSWSDDDIRDAINALLEPEEEDDEEQEEEPAPKKASKAATAKKEVAKKEVKEAKKTAAKPAEKAATKKGTRLNPKNNEEDRAAFDFLKKYFPESEYLYAWIAAGLTIKYKGKNSNRSIIGVENCFVKGEGKKAVMTCNVYLLLFNGKDEILEKAEIEFEKCWSGAPMLKSVESSELIEIIETLLPDMERMVKTVDKKLGDNRKKMEDNLKKEKAVKKPVSKKVVESEEDEDEEEENGRSTEAC